MRTARAAKTVFDNEAALCATFMSALPEGWTAYPETAGFDILLVRAADGAQIGIEAKMSLNAKVLLQSIEGMYSQYEAERAGPDWRGALVPTGAAGAEMKSIARRLGVTVIECSNDGSLASRVEEYVGYGYSRPSAERLVKQDFKPFQPELPAIGERWAWRSDWIDHCPPKRCPLPEYVPDVVAGASGPSSLSDWKIKAIKICVLLEKRGYVAISDFKALQIDRKRWLDMRWLTFREVDGVSMRGHYVAGIRPLDLRTQHPVNYLQVEADFDKWKPKDESPAQPALL